MLPNFLFAALSGILYVFSFAPWDQAWLQWFAFIPLFFAIDSIPAEKRNLKSIFLLGLTVSLLICIGGFYWMIHATMQYGGLPLPAALVVFAAFSLTGQLQVPLYLWFRQKWNEGEFLSKRNWFLSAMALGCAYAGIEALYPKLFQDTAGHAFYHSSWIRQAADIGGPFLLTALILSVNELGFLAIRLRLKAPLFAALALITITSGYGYFRNQQYSNLKVAHAGDSKLRVSMIQANIGDFLKFAAEQGTADAMNQVLGRYLRLSQQALAQNPAPDAIVWPETAYPAIYENPLTSLEFKMDQALRAFLKPVQANFIFGGYDIDSSNLEYNSVFFYHPQTKRKSIYHKNMLLMFGETLPFADAFPSMKSWFPTMGFFGRGPGPQSIDIENHEGKLFSLAPAICYEGLFTEHSAQGAILGADALLNVTNDSWFGEYGEPYLHLALTQFRSIETRLPLLRSTNTGITVAIDPMGETMGSTGVMQETVLTSEVQKRIMSEPPYLMMARVFGLNWFVRMIQVLVLITSGMMIFRHYRRYRQS
jgi:apolipoprotein N-acyltransferase